MKKIIIIIMNLILLSPSVSIGEDEFIKYAKNLPAKNMIVTFP